MTRFPELIGSLVGRAEFPKRKEGRKEGTGGCEGTRRFSQVRIESKNRDSIIDAVFIGLQRNSALGNVSTFDPN